MFRKIALIALPLYATGCASGSITPGTLPEGATSGAYTTVDTQTVAACIAGAIGGSVQTVGDRLVVASTRQAGLSYSVGPNKRNIVYPTQVAITGVDTDHAEAKRVDGCMVSSERTK